MKKTYSIISHTHWDREWYLPFEQFRIRLVDMMDNLLDVLSRDPEYRFHLDAQTIIIEDYLEIRPQRRDDIERYVKAGRLLIGPWYVQNDFHLTSGEATVRNLIIGKKIADAYGEKHRIGYAADQFGICSQLPQILNGFGIDSFIFGRGYGRGERQFYWQSENGSTLLCEHMTNWYNNLQRLPASAEAALALTRARADVCFANAKGSSALLMNGVDHLEAQEDLTEILHGMRTLLREDEELIQDTFPEYMSRLKSEIETSGLVLDTYHGEMRDLGQKKVLTGTLSSRIHLKQQNVRTQSAIEGVFEPQYAVLDALGVKKYPLDWSEYLWKSLIKNHPHDSICGCSVDAVHRHMEDRTLCLEEALTDLTARANEAYMWHLDREGVADGAILITCVNNSLYAYDGLMEAELDVPSEENTGAFMIKDCDGRPVPFEVILIERQIGKRILSPINLPGVKLVDRYKVRFRTTIDGMTRKTLICEPTDGTLSVAKGESACASVMENEFLRVEIHENGTANIFDKDTGVFYENAFLIEDNSDCDNNALYCYKLGGKEDICTSEGVKASIETLTDTKLEKSRRISFVMDIERQGERHLLPVTLVLTLRSGSRQLGVSVTLDNDYEDHRVRIYFPTGIMSDVNYAGQPFDVLERKKISDFENDEMHPNTSFVGIDGNGFGVAVLNRGIYEYEHMTDEKGTLALTLLRCAGCIGKYMAGAETPEGQCKGSYTLELAVYPYSGDRTSAGVAREADFFVNPPYTAIQHKDYNKFIGGRPFVQAAGVPDIFYRPLEHPEVVVPLEKTFLRLEQSRPCAMMLSAFKGAEDAEGQVIRLYNTTSDSVELSLAVGYAIKKAYLCTLDEQNVKDVPLTSAGRLMLTAAPKEIITVRVI